MQVVCLSLLISILYTVCLSYLFLYIEIRNREVRVIGAYRHTTYDSFSFFSIHFIKTSLCATLSRQLIVMRLC